VTDEQFEAFLGELRLLRASIDKIAECIATGSERNRDVLDAIESTLSFFGEAMSPRDDD
jgi:hypothetical protein